jgi:hypothetical protein
MKFKLLIAALCLTSTVVNAEAPKPATPPPAEKPVATKPLTTPSRSAELSPQQRAENDDLAKTFSVNDDIAREEERKFPPPSNSSR